LWAASLVLDRVLPVGVVGWWPDVTVSPEALRRQLEAILQAWGMAADHVAITADHILWADMRGIDSHGCSMIAHYHRRLVAGALAVRPSIQIVRDTDATALVDGGGGLGHVAADMAMKMAVDKCRAVGVGVVSVRNSGHFGAAGAYAALALQSGFIGVATTGTWKPAVVPTFGAVAMLGTNPLAFAAPASRGPHFLLDMATSAASIGKAMTAWRKGRSIPDGIALGPRGAAETSARVAAQSRRLTPLGSSPELGSHKGYGLAVAVEILSSILSGASAGGTYREGNRLDARQIGHFFLAIDPRRFRAAGEFESDLDDLADALRACPPIDREQPVLVAGDPERVAYAERSVAGIPLARSVIEDLRRVSLLSGASFTLGD
jgi:LDH2 family malate/lactate/ureidoglycolate dehydrogenase